MDTLSRIQRVLEKKDEESKKESQTFRWRKARALAQYFLTQRKVLEINQACPVWQII